MPAVPATPAHGALARIGALMPHFVLPLIAIGPGKVGLQDTPRTAGG